MTSDQEIGYWLNAQTCMFEFHDLRMRQEKEFHEARMKALEAERKGESNIESEVACLREQNNYLRDWADQNNTLAEKATLENERLREVNQRISKLANACEPVTDKGEPLATHLEIISELESKLASAERVVEAVRKWKEKKELCFRGMPFTIEFEYQERELIAVLSAHDEGGRV